MKKIFRSLLSTLVAAGMMLATVAMPLDGLLAGVFAAEPTPYVVVDDCDTTKYFGSYDITNKKQGEASYRASVSGKNTVQNTASFALPMTQKMLESSYMEMWLYVSKVSAVSRAKCTVSLYQSNTVQGTIKLSQLGTLRDGWNRLQFKLSDMDYQGKNKFDTLNRVVLNMETTSQVEIRLDDIVLIDSLKAGDLSTLEAAIAEGDALAAENLDGYDQSNVKTFRDMLAQAKSRLTGASQRDVDVAAQQLKNAMNAFGMEGVEEDSAALVAYIDFSTNKYSRIDRYAIRQANGGAGAVTDEALEGKKAAAFSGNLALAVNDEYLAPTHADVRVSFTYFDDKAGKLALEYTTADGAKKTAAEVEMKGTGAWVRKSVRVTDAALNEGIDNRFDLQLVLSGASLAYVARVEVKAVPENDITETPVPEFKPMTDVNNFEGKSVAGYQMWFTAASGTSGWVHWASGNIPSNDKISFEMWPDTSEYPAAALQNTAFNNLGDGRPAQLFTSVRDDVVDLHVSWMQDAGLDGFAIQRFYGAYLGEHAADNLKLAAKAAEKYDRLFYVMYDLNGALGAGNNAAEVLKSDFVRNVEQTGVIQSTSYAQMDGKPVVCMWGLDPTSDSYANHDASMEFICWLQDRGYYVAGGTSYNHPKQSGTDEAGNAIYTDWWCDGVNPFTDVYRQLDMVSPWNVGRYSQSGVASWMKVHVPLEQEACEKYGMDYQPVVLAGSGWHNHNWGIPNEQPRRAGQFLWLQAYILKEVYNCDRVYFAMFDEYDEATALMKAAQDSYDIPEDEQYFTTLSTDGIWLSSDFYLRLVGHICEVMRQEDPQITTQHGVVHSQGPIYWRNSFEQRWTYVRKEDTSAANGRTTIGVNLQPLDVCVPGSLNWVDGSFDLENDTYGVELTMKEYECSTYIHDEEYDPKDTKYKTYGTNQAGSGLHCDPGKKRTTNGTWSLQFAGKANSATDSWGAFRVATTDITISAAGLELSYDVLADNDLGCYAYMDLVLEVNGETKYLSDYVKSAASTGAKKGEWVSKTVALPNSLVGQKITGVVVAYKHNAVGEFNAYFDNALIRSPGNEAAMLKAALQNASALAEKSDALKAAIAAGEKVQNTSSSSNKQRLKAMKAIDSAIREMSVSAGDSSDVLWGDADTSGDVTTSDARLILQYCAELKSAEDLDLIAANVSGEDEEVTTADARLILQYCAELIDVFPVEE